MAAGSSLPTDFAVPTRSRALVALCILLILLGVSLEQYVERRYLGSREAERRDQLIERLSTVRYQLESTIANSLSVINGLAAFIASDPDFTPEQYSLYASRALGQASGLMNLSAAPDLVVRYVHPPEGNEAVVGVDYRQVTDQYQLVLQVVRNRAMAIAGPINLVQGGTAFVGRAPVYVIDEAGVERLWGVVSAVLRAEALYQQSGLYSLPSGMHVALRNRRQDVNVDVFFGSADIFDHPDRIIMPVLAGDSGWQLAAVNEAASISVAGLWWIRAGSAGILVLLMVLLTNRYRQFQSRQVLLKMVAHNEQFLRAVETVSRVGGWRWVDGQFTDLSVQARNIMRLPSDDQSVDMSRFCQSLDRHSAKVVADLFDGAQTNYQRISEELELGRADGTPIWLQIEAEIGGNSQDGVELIGTVQDITQAKKIDQLIEYQAHYDQLTGLPNRRQFQDRLAAVLRKSTPHGRKTAVLFLDLDHFKSINDNLGHAIGDALLIESARRIQSCVRSVDMVGRYSGDEFVAMLREVSSPAVISEVAENMISVMRRPFIINGHHMYCSISVGVSLYPEDGEDADTLIIKADQAMSQVKKSGRNAWQFYTVAMQHESEQRHRLYNELFEAINSEALDVVYQPVVDAGNGRVASCEALVRWKHPDGNWVSPAVFIPLAEERGLINRIELFVLQRSLAFVKEVNRNLSYPISLSVNVSPRLLQMRDDDALNWLRLLELENSVPVTLEITEGVFIDEAVQAQKILRQLHSAGFGIAIDDFGTGYSGLSYFSRFPVSVVKIDQSFVRRLERSHTETSLVETILSLAGKLNIKVVAEGVETEAQASFLQRHGCDYLQGHFIAKPLTAAEFVTFLHDADAPCRTAPPR